MGQTGCQTAFSLLSGSFSRIHKAMNTHENSEASTRQDQVHGRILALITDGTLIQGDKLPSESELSARFGVSRPTVREALSRLRNAGVVVARKGAGTFVQSAGSVA